MRRTFVLLSLIFLPAAAGAQGVPATRATGHFAAELAGGALGSAAGAYAGVAIGLAGADCTTFEVNCGLAEVLRGVVIGSVVGSALGAHLGSRVTGGEPSAVGNVFGAAAGVLMGVAVAGLLTPSDAPGRFVVTYSLGQGTLAAAGGRFESMRIFRCGWPMRCEEPERR